MQFRPEWWNWQTRTTQNRVLVKGMWVQVPPLAPAIIKTFR